MDRVVLITAKLSPDTQRAQGESSPYAKLSARTVRYSQSPNRPLRPRLSAKKENDRSRAHFLQGRKLKRDRLQKLELQPGLRVNHRCAGGMSIVRLSRCLWRACRLDAARLYRDPTSIHIDRGEFHSQWPGFARISARGRDLSECFGSSSQYDISLNRNILRDLRLEASSYHTLRSDKANGAYR